MSDTAGSPAQSPVKNEYMFVEFVVPFGGFGKNIKYTFNIPFTDHGGDYVGAAMKASEAALEAVLDRVRIFIAKQLTFHAKKQGWPILGVTEANAEAWLKNLLTVGDVKDTLVWYKGFRPEDYFLDVLQECYDTLPPPANPRAMFDDASLKED